MINNGNLLETIETILYRLNKEIININLNNIISSNLKFNYYNLNIEIIDLNIIKVNCNIELKIEKKIEEEERINILNQLYKLYENKDNLINELSNKINNNYYTISFIDEKNIELDIFKYLYSLYSILYGFSMIIKFNDINYLKESLDKIFDEYVIKQLLKMDCLTFNRITIKNDLLLLKIKTLDHFDNAILYLLKIENHTKDIIELYETSKDNKILIKFNLNNFTIKDISFDYKNCDFFLDILIKLKKIINTLLLNYKNINDIKSFIEDEIKQFKIINLLI